MAGVKRVSPLEAQQLVGEGYTYVDVRSEPEFLAGHPAGAVNVPIMNMGPGGMSPNPEFLAVMRRAFASDAKLIVGCKSGGRSLRAAELLVSAGFTQVIDQRAGFDGGRSPFGALTEPGWEKAGLPVERGAPPARTYADLRARR